MSDGRSLGWCITINNPTEEDSIEELKKHAQYVIVGKEVGEKGTPHLQGYAYFKTKKSMAQLKQWLPRAHLLPARGTPEENQKYCSKDGNFIEFGTPPMSRKRKGECGKEFWDDVKAKAIAGDIDGIPSKVFVSHYRTLKAIAYDHRPKPENLADPCQALWFWGPTGTGKSRRARSDYPDAYLKMCNKWWDGYSNEETVIIEDFDKKHDMLGHHLKIWADRYSFPAEVKGGKINIRPKRIIITSNWHPCGIFTDKETIEPILRRFQVIEFPEATQE